MKYKVNHLSHEYTNLTEVGDRIGVDIKEEVVPIMCMGDAPCMVRTLGVGQDIILIVEVIMVTTHEVIRGIQETIVIEGMIIETDFMTEIGVGHLKDRIDVGEMTEV